MGNDGKWTSISSMILCFRCFYHHPQQSPGTSTALAWPLSGTLPAASWMTRPKSLTLAPFLGSHVWDPNMGPMQKYGFIVFKGRDCHFVGSEYLANGCSLDMHSQPQLGGKVFTVGRKNIVVLCPKWCPNNNLLHASHPFLLTCYSVA